MKRLLPICLMALSACSGSSGNISQFIATVNGGSGGAGSDGSSGGTSSGIQILSTLTVTGASIVGNIVYDGTRLLIPDTTGAGLPVNNNVSFDYISLTPTLQTTSVTDYAGGWIYYGSQNSSTPTAGQSALFWTTGGEGPSGTLSVRDDSSGTVQSNTSIDFTNYGCPSSGPITFCSGNYYGACINGTSVRLFSFNTSGTLQSAVTTSNSNISFNSVGAITCYNGSSLLLSASGTYISGSCPSCAYGGFSKYDLSFGLIATDSVSPSSWDNGVAGIATDGTYLYLQGVVSSGSYVVGKATLGDLQ